VSRPLRFTFILGLAALATALAAVGGWRFARASAPVSGPIIVISIDTLRADHLPAYGYRGVPTPAIDALAADGVLFERAYSHTPQTLPAHAAILTGRLPSETGVRDDVGFTVKAGERLLAQMLRDRGYTTAGVVSSFVLRKDTGIAQGFDFFDADIPAGRGGIRAGQVKRDGAVSEAIAERWFESIGSARAFVFLHLDEPHAPYLPPERFSEYPPYDAEIAYSDAIVGRFIRYLKSHQLYDRSTIVLLSDHGEGLRDHGEQEHGVLLHEEAIHVPLVIKQEGNAGAGRRVADLVQHIDLVPTILELVKAPVPGNLRGRSLKPLLDGTGHLPARSVYSEALYGRYRFGWSELTSLTDERYRYIKAPHEELYDLQRDPREQTNIADERRVRDAMRRALDRMADGATIRAVGDVTAEARERLQAIEYVSTAGAGPESTLADPKEKLEVLDTYRTALDAAAGRRWAEAIALFQETLRELPEAADIWRQLAETAEHLERYDVATDAYRHYVELRPSEPEGYLGAAAVLLKQRKLEEARAQAAQVIEIAAKSAQRMAGHELLARIALARRDADTARQEADIARDADPRTPLPTFVQARLLYDEGRFVDALPLFEQALAEQQKRGGASLAELHYYAADTYAHLERYADAEAQFAAELREFPHNIRARGGLALLYHAMDRLDAAAAVIGELTDITPTPESYALAARLWTAIGNRLQADAVRAAARSEFPEAVQRNQPISR